MAGFLVAGIALTAVTWYAYYQLVRLFGHMACA